jgi:hypothetical protein
MRGDLQNMTNESKVKKLIKQLNTNLDLYEIPKYKITEISDRNGKNSYTVHSLEAEMEDGGVYFGDMNDVIFNNQYALMGFLINSIVNIKFEDKVTTIMFRSNSIAIEFVG